MPQSNPPVQITFTALPVIGATIPITGSGPFVVSGRTVDGADTPLCVDASGSVFVNSVGLNPPDGGTIAGDNASHALGSLSGSGYVVIVNEGPDILRLRSSTVLPTTGSGMPVPQGSYSWSANAVEDVRIFVPTATTMHWGVHQ